MSKSNGAAVKFMPNTMNMGTSHIFRQVRYVNDQDQLEIELLSEKGTVRNWSRTGIGFEITKTFKSQLKVGDLIEKVILRCGDIVLFEGNLEIKSKREVENGLDYFGASFASSLFLVEGVESALAIHRCSQQLKSSIENSSQVNPEFCQSVVGLASALRAIKETCQFEEARWRKLTFDRRCEAERVFLPNMAYRVKEVLVHFNKTIARQVDVEKLSENSPYHQLFNEEIYPFFKGSDLVRRAYEKPRGYAGDYEMMNQMYRNGFEGEDLFGRVLHHYSVNENSSESVKFRRPYFLSHYETVLSQKKGEINVLSIACGPAVEVQEIVNSWSQPKIDRLKVTLFDLDREALEHAQTKIYENAVTLGKRANLHFVNASVKTFLTINTQSGEKFDLIYSGGLFDYIDQNTSAALIKKFSTMLNPGGTLVIGNFTKDNTTKAFLHLLAKWSLIHKTEDEMRAWADGITDCSVKIDYDPNRINAFLVLKKNEAG